ncbi:MAG TPA: hypothetical protein VFI02_14325 [Armatimonadota bacterium]|nr:hypothetical protein [Armatimonadota bacterium]
MKTTRRHITISLAILCLVAMPGAFQAAYSQSTSIKVFIKVSTAKKSAWDIFIKDYRTGKATKFITVTDVYQGHYHPAEYHNGHVYVIRRRGDVHGPTWTDELWRYDRNSKGTKLWSSKGLDFRVRDDEGMIAVLAGSKQGPERNLYLVDRVGKLIKTFPPEQLVSTDMSFEKWDGRFLWLADEAMMTISSFVRVDSNSMAVKKYNLTELDLAAEDYALNPTSLRLAYSDYPVMFETDTAEDFRKEKTPVKLYIYDLSTRHRRLIARAIAEPFNPKWANPSTLEYDNPRGKGRIQKRIR